MYVIIGIFVAILGFYMVKSPDIFYELSEVFRSQSSGEPSDFYILSTKIGGVMFIVAGVAVAIGQFLIE